MGMPFCHQLAHRRVWTRFVRSTSSAPLREDASPHHLGYTLGFSKHIPTWNRPGKPLQVLCTRWTTTSIATNASFPDFQKIQQYAYSIVCFFVKYPNYLEIQTWKSRILKPIITYIWLLIHLTSCRSTCDFTGCASQCENCPQLVMLVYIPTSVSTWWFRWKFSE